MADKQTFNAQAESADNPLTFESILKSSKDLSANEITKIQTHLKEEGLYTADVSGQWNFQTEAALTDYMVRYPQTISQVNSTILQDIITPNTPGNEQDEASSAQRLEKLQKALNDNPAARASFIKKTSDSILHSEGRSPSDDNEPSAQTIKNQTLMKVAGYYSGEIGSDALEDRKEIGVNTEKLEQELKSLNEKPVLITARP